MSSRPSLHRPNTLAALFLIAVFLAQVLILVRRQAMTNDEGYHTFAGYHYWQCRDFGVNAEHPPLAKLVAALPLRIGGTPPPAGDCATMSTLKGDGYASSNQWYLGTTSAPPRLDADQTLWHARLSISIFALALALAAYFFTRAAFGPFAAVACLLLLAFEPSLIAHGALVATDTAVSAMSLLATFAFYRYHRHPTSARLFLAGLCCGLTFAVKHSGVLLLPVLVLVTGVEIGKLWRNRQVHFSRAILQRIGALAAVLLIGYATLWATYTFRYSARPPGSELSIPLASFIQDTSAKGNRSLMLHIIPVMARFHLLPEAYLYGFVDVLSISNPGQSSYLLGHLYPHGVPQYFPVVVLIKSTLGMLALGLLSSVAALRRRLRPSLGALYLLAPICVWMLAGMNSTLNIGYRHVLPIVAPACCLLGAAAAALWRRSPQYRFAVAACLLAHVISSFASFPNQLAYANEAWGGPRHIYRWLTDANNDWGQAVNRVPGWLASHHIKDCWLAYDGILPPQHYGVNCRYLVQNAFGVAGPAPPDEADGTFIVSGLSASGIEWERPDLNPYAPLLATQPVDVIGGAMIVFQGHYSLKNVRAVHLTVQASGLNNDKRFADAEPLARASLEVLPTSCFAHLELARALQGMGLPGSAHHEFAQAKRISEAQPEWYFLQKPAIDSGYASTAAPGTHP